MYRQRHPIHYNAEFGIWQEICLTSGAEGNLAARKAGSKFCLLAIKK
jgi:hypothetical protein